MSELDDLGYIGRRVEFHKPADHFSKVPALAARLGVEPTKGEVGSFLLQMNDGACYDVFELINAFLDRLEPPPTN